MDLSSSMAFLLVLFVAISSAAPKNGDKLELCVSSAAELRKCQSFTDIDCVLGSNALDCIVKVENYEADITVLDGGDINLAGKCHNLKPIIAEGSATMPAGTGYYAVAVAKKESSVNINSLEGTKSCHTGLNKTSGWFVPMSVLFTDKADQEGQASDFFSESCVPGAQVGSNLCDKCTTNCKRSSANPYYGYDGAAKCLSETDADVAFVKHNTFLNHPQKDLFELLCRNGGVAPIDDYVNCHLAAVPSHAVVARQDISAAGTDYILAKFQETPVATLFTNDDLIFSDKTTSLSTTYGTYTEYLGANYIAALPDTTCAKKPCVVVKCFVHPCEVTKCTAYPEAVCRANYCGGCNADFFVDNVKVDCGEERA